MSLFSFKTSSARSNYVKIINYNGVISASLSNLMQTIQNVMNKTAYIFRYMSKQDFFLWWEDLWQIYFLCVRNKLCRINIISCFFRKTRDGKEFMWIIKVWKRSSWFLNRIIKFWHISQDSHPRRNIFIAYFKYSRNIKLICIVFINCLMAENNILLVRF